MGEITISKEEYKELLENQIKVEIFKKILKTEKYLTTSDACRFFDVEVEEE